MKINWNDEQLKIFNKIGFSFDVQKELNSEQLIEIEDKVSEYLQLHGITANDEVNDIGRKCESILDKLSF